jgi:serine phosphatase RsbU (regulator of sigma subunit)
MPSTTSHPTSALRAALVALGLGLLVLIVTNIYLVGRQATDENLFVNPPSRAYVVSPLEGTPGEPTGDVGDLPGFFPRDVTPDTRVQAGDLLVSVEGTVTRTLERAREVLTLGDNRNVVVLRPSDRDTLFAVRVPAQALSDALRSIDNTVLVIDVTPGGASDRAGMLVGDVITRINGQGFSTAFEADDVMRQSDTERETVYDILRGGTASSLNVRLAFFGVSLGRILLMLVGLVYVAAGLVLTSLRAHIKAARYLGLAWMGVGIVLALLFTGQRRGMAPWFTAVTDVCLAGGGMFGLAAWLHALHYFPRERTALIARRWVRPTAYGLAAVGTAGVLTVGWRAAGPGFVGLLGPALVLYLLFVVAVTWRTRIGYGAEERQILRPLTRSTAVTVSVTLAVFVGGVLLARGGQPPLPVFVLLASVYLALLGVHVFVIGRYRLLESDLRVRRNVQFLVASSAWTTIVVGAGLWLWWALVQTELPLPNIRLTGETLEVLGSPVSAERRAVVEKAVLIAAAVVFAFAFRALLKRGHRFLAEQYYREGYDYRKASQELAEVTGSRMDLDGLADGLLTVIDRLMPVKKAGVAFVEGSRIFAAKRSTGFEHDEWNVFCHSCLQDALAALKTTPAEFDTEYAPPRLRLALRKSDIHYLYPIRGHNQLRGLLFIGEKLSESAYNADDFTFLNVIASQASLLVENAFLYENLAQRERAQQELAIARRIQIESLPHEAPRFTGLDVAGMSVPAQEVGGDYFDYLCGVPDVLGTVVGDVSGKGTSAALYMSKLQGIVRSLHSFELGARDLFIRTNDLLGRDLERRSFVTALGGFFDSRARVVTIARAGHLPLLRYEAASGRVHRHAPTGIGFGLTSTRQFVQELQEERIAYDKGDVFLFVTDGITESHSTTGDDYGEERLSALLREMAGSGFTAAAMVARVKASVDAFTEGMEQHDDQTVLAVRVI